MPVSKRTRFEVLRRDNYTCRYCRSTENEITIDHVVPVSLGGPDDPGNLVAACRDCNLGKASASPDASLVAQVEEDAVRWARAMGIVAARQFEDRKLQAIKLADFQALWDEWTVNSVPSKLPPDWEDAIIRQLAAGLDMNDLDYAVKATMAKTWITDEFRYFMGVCRTMISQRMEAARLLIENGDA